MGPAHVMHGFLSRVLDFHTIVHSPHFERELLRHRKWDAELYAESWLNHACGPGSLTEWPGIHMHPWRTHSRGTTLGNRTDELPPLAAVPRNMIVMRVES